MRGEKLLKTIFFAVVLLLAPLAAPGKGDLVIVNTADLHSFADGTSPLAARIAGERERAASEGDDFLYLDCGDSFQGTFGASRDRGRGMVGFFRAAGLDATVPGNHDLDFGIGTFSQRCSELSDFAAMLAANLKIDGAKIAPFKIFSLRHHRVAVIGLAENQLDRRLPPSEKFRLLDETRSLENACRAATEQKPDVVILLRHGGKFGGRTNWNDLIRKHPEIDLVFGGHTHKIVAGERAGGSFYVQSGCHGEGYSLARVRKLSGGQKVISSFFASVPKKEEKGRSPSPPAGRLRSALPAVAAGSENAPFPLLAATALKEFAGADASIFECGATERSLEGEIGEFELYRLFPFEDRAAVVEVSSEEYRSLLKSCRKNLKKHHSALGFVEPDSPGKERITLALSSYMLAGAGSRHPGFAALFADGKRKWRELDVPMREIFRRRALVPEQSGKE